MTLLSIGSSERGSIRFDLEEKVGMTIYGESDMGDRNVIYKSSSDDQAIALYKDSLTSRTSSGVLLALFVPPRTHNLKELLLDVLIPNTRRINPNYEGCSKLALTITMLCLDILSIVIRVLTLLPRMVYNAIKTPDLKKVVERRVESIFVKCQKSWNLKGTEEGKEEAFLIRSAETTFSWRVDIYPPLRSVEKIVHEADENKHRLALFKGSLYVHGLNAYSVSETTLENLHKACATPVVKFYA